ncbi:hypothetical protein N1851_018466 [Merluccius polli]|uniref:CCHC-type domain-containing protein n=1 Tax=Merluccius polli TaxID=89951 RepID=A0AA47MNP5_MERPO|nr:hypothetical protein N1851_018466 [Merluccius polli]
MNEIRTLLVEDGTIERVEKKLEVLSQSIEDLNSIHKSVQSLMNEEEKELDTVDWYEPRSQNFDYFFNEVKTWKKKQLELQLTVDAKDSISNVSKISRTSSAARVAAAEKAALQARKKECLELQAQFAEADARLKALSEDGEQGDAMNEYLEASKQQPAEPTLTEASALEFAPVATVPKTPLQKAVLHLHSSSRSVRTSTSPHLETSQDSAADTEMLNRQKELTEFMVRQQNLSLLPKRDVPVFNGDPLSFQPFILAFEHSIESNTSNCQDRLYFLEQFTEGQARDIVRSCMHMEARRGYAEAKQLLKKYFGNEMKIANAYLEKAFNWTLIRPDDGKALLAYALYLRECLNTMQVLDHLEELNVASNLKLLVSKLPYKLRERWRNVVYETSQRNDTRIRFTHLVDFLERQASVLLHPVFGDIRDPPPSKSPVLKAKPDTKTPRRGSSFVTSVTPAEVQVPSQPANTQQSNKSVEHLSLCSFCSDRHDITDCKKLKSQPHKQKVEDLRKNGHCFGCLKKGHLSKTCTKRMICETCQYKHPTLLHINGEKAAQMQTPVNSALITANYATGASHCALAIVPVLVKASKGSRTIMTYAFLDPGSTATFCSENIMHQLKVNGRRTEVALRTMGQEQTVKCYEITGLEVGHIDGSKFIELPTVYTQGDIPVSKDNLLTQNDLKRFPYLSGITLQSIDADVEILIGMDVPKAMEPWQVLNSQNDGPYAVKTLLGWVVNGPLNSCPAMDRCGKPSVTVNRISLENITNLLIRQYNNDFPEKEREEKREMSVEDRRFMDLTSRSATFKNGHYHLPLPFRHEDVTLPNNQEVAAQHTVEDLSHLPHSDPELKRDITVNYLKLETNATSSLIQYFSSWKKLLSAVAWLLKLKNLLLLRSRKEKDNLTSKIKGMPVKADSFLSKLDPILDKGILRIGGRLSKTSMPVSLRNPIILPRDSYVSKLILRDIHHQVGHAG